MAHYDCEVKAVLGQAIISLKSTKERDNVVAILIITEVSLPAPPLCPPTPRKQVRGLDFQSYPPTHRPPDLNRPRQTPCCLDGLPMSPPYLALRSRPSSPAAVAD